MEPKFTKLDSIPLDGQFSGEESLSSGTVSTGINIPPVVNRRRCLVNPWMLSTLVLACTTVVLFVQSLNAHTKCPSFDPTTQFFGTRQQQIQFSGALTWNESGQLVNEHNSEEELWTGPPSPEMDNLWDSLEDVWTVLLEGEDANLVRDKTLMYDGYWMSGVDVFHQMHCLDAIRRATYPDYYHSGEKLGRTARLHLDHCVDYLRQAIMCHADTTPVPQQWVQGAHRYGPNFATVHSCGSFDEVLAWAKERTAEAREGRHGGEVAEDPIVVVTKDSFYGTHEGGH